MAFEIRGVISPQGIPVGYWRVDSYSVRRESWPTAKANDPDRFGKLPPIPGTGMTWVPILQMLLSGYASQSNAKDGYFPLVEGIVVEVVGEEAGKAASRIKAGENALAVCYETFHFLRDKGHPASRPQDFRGPSGELPTPIIDAGQGVTGVR